MNHQGQGAGKPAAIAAAGLALALVLAAPAAAEDWARVSAIFAERCVLCHSGESAPLGLSLDSHDGVTAGSENGPVVVAEAPETSPLYRRITGAAEPRMPLDGPPFLAEPDIATIRAWIANGAPGPDATAAAAPETAPDTAPDSTPDSAPEAATETAPQAATPAAPAPAPEAPAPPDPYADGMITFDEVARIFLQRCIECHSDNSKMGAPPERLRLKTRDQILAGGDRAVVIPGNPLASELIRRVEGRARPRMPLDGPPWLTDAEIALLRDWIGGGALDAAGTPAPLPVGARVRYRGSMTAPDALDGIPFTIGPGTRLDNRPAVGQAAELRGRVAPDGTIEAERLRRR